MCLHIINNVYICIYIYTHTKSNVEHIQLISQFEGCLTVHLHQKIM